MRKLRTVTGPRSESGLSDAGVFALPIDLESRVRLGVLNRFLKILSAFVVVGLVVASIAPIRELSVAPGQIAPSTALRPVSHLEGGVVDEILVSAGEVVEAGQVMIRLAPQQTAADFGQFDARRAGLIIQRIRLRALNAGEEPDFSAFRQSFPDLVAEQQALYENELATLELGRATFATRVAQRRGERDAAAADLIGLQRQMEIETERLALRRQLAREGYASRNTVLESEAALVRAETSHKQARGQLAVAEQALLEAEALMRENETSEALKRSDRLAEATAELAEVEQQLLKQGDRRDRLNVRAPVAGVVQEIVPKSPNEVISPGETVARIVPVDDRMIAEVRVRPEDIGHVEIGAEVRLKVLTYDAEVDGFISATVDRISASTFQAEDNSYYYLATLGFDDIASAESTLHRQIQPGMTVQAEIVTGEKSLMRYLLKPVFRSLDKAFSER